MATALSLALRITGDASGLKLTPVERALKQLETQTQSLTGVFDQFKAGSAAAGAAQQKFATDLGFLQSALKTGQITAQEFAKEFETITTAAKEQAALFAEGARETAAAVTAEERRNAQLERLKTLLDAGAISEENYARRIAEVSGANDAVAKAEAERAAALAKTEADRARILSEGEALTRSLATQEERRASELARIEQLLAARAISEETYYRAIQEASGANAAAAKAEAERAAALAQAESERKRILSEGEALTRSLATQAERRAEELEKIEQLLSAGAISEETYARAIEKASGAVDAAAEAERARKATLDEGKRVTDQFATAEEKRAAELARLQSLLDAGAISEETFSRATAEASGANAEAARAEKQRADALAAASRIIQANLSPQEKYDQQIQELRGHLEAGRLSQEQFNRAATKAAQDLERVGTEAGKTDRNIDSLAKNVRILSAIEIGRVLVDGLQLIGNAFNRVTSQLTAVVTSVNASLDTLNDFSARTGIGIEALQGYSLAAKLAGVDAEQFGLTVQRLAVSIGKASAGDQFDKSLQSIGLSVRELRALAPEEQFSAIGEAISQLPTAADRAAAAVEIFGKQGAALAPLFRDGAASLDELRDRAERLGIIVSETQVSNVADMNDAFDLVRATIEGIIGQVIGNLAPAVTAVTNEFLKFIETWEGAEGTGGTGIANAITDTLLRGAEFFARIFDKFMANFTGISTTLADVGEVFRVGGQLLLSGMEGFRTVFNVIQLGIDNLLIGFGKVLEAIGSYVSDDLEQFGSGLAAASEESAKKNAEEMKAAAENAANAFNSIFTAGGNAEAAAKGEAEQYVSTLSEEIRNARLPGVKVQADLETATKDLDKFLKTAEGGTSEFLQQSQATLETFSKMAAEGELTATQIKIMNGFMESLNGELTKEKQLRQDALDAAKKQGEEDAKRIEGLLKVSDATTKIEEDLATVTREIERAAAAQVAARDAGDASAASAAAARVAELDQLQAKLEENLQAAEQGFGQGGFGEAFRKVNEDFTKLNEKALEFGQAGFDAALRLQEGIQQAQEQARSGILNQEAFDQEVARQQKLFENEIKNIDEANKARIKAGEEAIKAQEKAQADALKQQEKAEQDIAKAQEQAQQQYLQQQQKALEERKKAEEAEFARQSERLRELNTLGSRTVQTNDVRTQEGAALVLGLAANAQDPRLIEARIQTKLQRQFVASILSLNGRLAGPSTIL